MKGPFSFVMSLVVAVLLGCVTPTGGCACSPPLAPIKITGIVLNAVGAPASAATVVSARGASSSCDPIVPADQRTVSARADGTFEITGFFERGPECQRVQAFPPSGSSLGPSTVAFVRFGLDGAPPATVSLRLQAAP